MPQSNPSRDAEIARAAKAGASRNELAERYGLCRTRISQICMAAGLAEITRAAKAGASRNELAERYGLCRTRISQICMAAGLPKLKPGRKKSDG